MTTEPTIVDAATAERLAKLRARRERTTDTPPEVTPSVERSRRRRSPASTSKIVTAGATATATLGLIALYGAAERRSAAADEVQPAEDAATIGSPMPEPRTVDQTVAPASPTTTPTPPRIVVVVVDGGGSDEAIAAAIDAATGAFVTDTVTGDVSTSTIPMMVAEPVPVATPTVVDLAVPAPPRPATPSAPAPEPQATSDGS